MQFIKTLKAKLIVKWAKEFGLTIVKIERVGNIEYLVTPDGIHRKLSRKN